MIVNVLNEAKAGVIASSKIDLVYLIAKKVFVGFYCPFINFDIGHLMIF